MLFSLAFIAADLVRERRARAALSLARKVVVVDETPGVTRPIDPFGPISNALEGRYRIIRELGHGGNAIVYLADDLKNPRSVAIKVLRSQLAGTVSAERFQREIELLCQFQHPNILTLIDAGQIDDLRYYVMPHVPDGSLRHVLKQKKQLGVEETIRQGVEIAEALAYAHERGYVHRDIKPENILISSGRPMVSDFGIARSVARGTGSTLTLEGQTIGTPAYMSPEQISPRQGIDGRSDIYSLGCVLFEMLAGAPPFTGATDENVLHQHLTAPPPPVTQYRPQAGTAIDRVISRCLAKNPADRFDTASALASALRDSLAPAPPPHPGPTKPLRPPSPIPWKRVVIAASAALVLTVVGLLMWKRIHPLVPETIAVMPFAVHSAANQAYLGEGIVALVNNALSGVDQLRCIDPQSILIAAANKRGVPVAPSAARAREIASRFGAGRFLLGEIFETGPHVQIQANIFETNGGDTPTAQISVDGDTSQFLSLATEISQSALASLTSVGQHLTTVAATSTQSLPAFRAYVSGESALRLGETQAAVNHFKDAVESDSTFSLAWYRLSWALQWNNDYVQALEASDRAWQSSRKLSSRDRLLLRGLRAYLYGATAEAESVFRAISSSYPDDSEGWYMLGETYMHLNPMRGRFFVEAKDPFKNAIGLWPKQWEARYHLAEIYAFEHQVDSLDAVVADGLKAGLDPEEAYYQRILLGFSRADTAQQKSLLAELTKARVADPILSMSELAFFVGDLEQASHFVEIQTLPSFEAVQRGTAYIYLSNLALARGRWVEAQTDLSKAEALNPLGWVNQRAMLCLHPYLSPSPSDLRAVRDVVQAWSSSSWSKRSEESAQQPPGRPYRDYLLGLLDLRLGDERNAMLLAQRLAAGSGPPEAITTSRDFARSLRSDQAWRAGRAKDALDALTEFPLVPAFVPGPYALKERVYSRWQMAELLRINGQREEAITWYEMLPYYSPFGLVLMGPSYLEAAKIAESLGDRERAARDYARVVRLWQGCDPEFQPHLKEAEDGLARVSHPG